jgi:tRNA1(Val) A37 N6-methylase TrmN6
VTSDRTSKSVTQAPPTGKLGNGGLTSLNYFGSLSEPVIATPADTTNRSDVTHGHLLGGLVHYAQPRRGFRSGIEPVLLAAAIPARDGSRVLEGGCGAGATLLCLAARVPGVQGLGIDQDAAVVALARDNGAANGWPDLRFITADVASLQPLGAFDHACANPPYHSEFGTPSPDASRRTAKRAAAGTLTVWATALARPLEPRGTLTFILPATLLPEATAAFAAAGCYPTALLPLWPKPRDPAKLVLLRGVKGSRAPFRVLAGLVLHGPDGAFTAAADAILRGGRPLEL